MTYSVSINLSESDISSMRNISNFYVNQVQPQIRAIEDKRIMEREQARNRVTLEDTENATKMIKKAREFIMLDEKNYDSKAESFFNTARYLNPSLTKEVEQALHAFHLNKRRVTLVDLISCENEIGIDKGEIAINDNPYLEDENYKRL